MEEIEEDTSDEEATSAAAAEAKQKSKDAWNEILKTPPLTDSHVLARKRVLRKTPEGKRKKGLCKSENSGNMLQKRLTQFPTEPLIIVNKQEYCKACSTIVSNKKSCFIDHVGCKSHKDKVEVLRFNSQSQHNLHQHVVTTMPDINANKEIEMTYRLEVCSAFLMEGISFVKLTKKNRIFWKEIEPL